MAKGRAGRTYTRDSRGRFSSSPGGGKAGGKAKPAAPARAKRAPAAAKAPKATAKPTAPAKRPAGAPRGPKPAPPPWSPAMKQAAAKAKAQRAEVKGRPAAANKIAASPRRLNPQEKAIASVLSSAKFRSDSAKRRELANRGFKVSQEDLLKGSQRVRKKLGLPIVSMGDSERKAHRAAMKRAAGEASRKRRG